VADVRVDRLLRFRELVDHLLLDLVQRRGRDVAEPGNPAHGAVGEAEQGDDEPVHDVDAAEHEHDGRELAEHGERFGEAYLDRDQLRLGGCQRASFRAPTIRGTRSRAQRPSSRNAAACSAVSGASCVTLMYPSDASHSPRPSR
jgi:hypothetical protein